jgi:hypothetical protein
MSHKHLMSEPAAKEKKRPLASFKLIRAQLLIINEKCKC